LLEVPKKPRRLRSRNSAGPHEAQVLDSSGNALGGLFAAGEILGGLYYHNYGSGTGLVAGVVFGRLAGEGAARVARRNA
jgi:tricarballylate dehydrogenase